MNHLFRLREIDALQKKIWTALLFPFRDVVHIQIEMERGKLIYSAKDNKMVLVTAPLLLILADNPALSDIYRILGIATTFPCKKYYYRKLRKHADSYYQLTKKQKSRQKRDIMTASLRI